MLRRAIPVRPRAILTAFTVTMDHFRKRAKDSRWLDRGAEVEEQQAPTEDRDDEARLPGEPATPPWLLSTWLEEQIKGHANDERTYGLIVRAARKKKSWEQIAQDEGVSANAIYNRVHRFKNKYEPLRLRHEKERRDRILWLIRVGGAAVAIAIGVLWWLFWRHPREQIHKDWSVAPPSSPSASAAPVFDQALPPPGPPLKTDPGLKPGGKPAGK